MEIQSFRITVWWCNKDDHASACNGPDPLSKAGVSLHRHSRNGRHLSPCSGCGQVFHLCWRIDKESLGWIQSINWLDISIAHFLLLLSLHPSWLNSGRHSNTVRYIKFATPKKKCHITCKVIYLQLISTSHLFQLGHFTGEETENWGSYAMKQ